MGIHIYSNMSKSKMFDHGDLCQLQNCFVTGETSMVEASYSCSFLLCECSELIKFLCSVRCSP